MDTKFDLLNNMDVMIAMIMKGVLYYVYILQCATNIPIYLYMMLIVGRRFL